jgi:hypothetical protein
MLRSRVNVGSNYTHPAIGHEYARVFHHLRVVGDGREFSGRFAQLLRHVAELLFVSGLCIDLSVLAKVAVHMRLLLKVSQCSCSLVKLLLFISKDFMVVNQAVIDVRIIVLFLTNFSLQEVLEVSLGAVWAMFSMVVEVSEFLISMLRLSDDGLSLNGSFQIRLVE